MCEGDNDDDGPKLLGAGQKKGLSKGVRKNFFFFSGVWEHSPKVRTMKKDPRPWGETEPKKKKEEDQEEKGMECYFWGGGGEDECIRKGIASILMNKEYMNRIRNT